MSQNKDKTEVVESKSLSNFLYILIKNEAESRVKENYSTGISEEYDMSDANASRKLSRLDKEGLIESRKDGRRKVYTVNWTEVTSLIANHDKIYAYYPMLSEEEFVNSDVEELDEFSETIQNLAENEDFQDLLKKILLKYFKKEGIEKTEGGHLAEYTLLHFFEEVITRISYSAYLLDNQIKAIEKISDLSTEEAVQTLRVESGKKELLNNLRGIQHQYDYSHMDLEQLSPIKRVTVDVFDDYFGIYSENPLMIEKDFLDRLP